MRARASPCFGRIAIAIAIVGAATSVWGGESVFADGFEKGDCSRWSSVQPPESPIFRFATDAVSINENDLTLALDVVFDRASELETRVRVKTVDGTAVGGVDFVAINQILTFAPGVTRMPVMVDVVDDLSYEPEESFSITLSDPFGGVLKEPFTSIVTITPSDWPPFIFLANGGDFTAQYDAFEQDGLIGIPVRLSNQSGFRAEVVFTSSGGTATDGEDFQGFSGDLVFEPGEIEKLIAIPIYQDGISDSGETIDLALSDAVGCTLDGYLPNEGIVVIRDDAWVSFTESEVSAAEGAESAVVAVTLSTPLLRDAYVSYSTGGGSATPGVDYTEVSNVLLFAPGITTRYFGVPLTPDSDVEGDETFSITLADALGVPLGSPSTLMVTVLDDELPEVGVAQPTASIGEGDGQVDVLVTLSSSNQEDVSVDFVATDGSAADGMDYIGNAGTLVIPGGQMSGVIPIAVRDDGFVEGNESFNLSLSNPQDAYLRSRDTTTVTIIDDDEVGVLISPTSLQTIENGRPGTVNIALTSQPAADVTLIVASTDISEGTVTPETVVFGPATWDTPQQVAVIPVDDAVIDGHVRYQIETQPAMSADPDYAGHDASDIDVTNFDSEFLALVSEPIDGRIFDDGEVLRMEATSSAVPAGYQTWFAVLRDDGSSDPLDLVHQATGLGDSFVASNADASYRVRVVISAPGSMPPDGELRGRDLPCTLAMPNLECDSNEAVLTRAESWQPTRFETVYELPEGVFLRWAGPEILFFERSADDGETWIGFVRSETENYFVDEGVAEGTTYRYRARAHPTHPWVYLGGTTTAPGLPVVIPVWAAPRILPQLDDVTWRCPAGAARLLCEGTLRLRLVGEPGSGSISGATIRVFLNEETFELSDGNGDEIHTEFIVENGYLLDFKGYDLPGCVVRKTIPDVEIHVPPGEEEIGIDLPGVIYGANGLRFEVETPSGDMSDRAILVALLDAPVQTDHTVDYPPFLPMLFGTVLVDNEPLFLGVGPASRPSPDCADGNSWYYFDHWPDYVTDLFLDRISFAGEEDILIAADESGGWRHQYGPYDDGAYEFWIKPPGGGLPGYGSLGRIIERPGGGFWTADFAPQMESSRSGVHVNLTIDSTVADLAPELVFVEETVLIDSGQPIEPAVISFRITDADHDLEMSTVRVFNCSLETCLPGRPGEAPHNGFFSQHQQHPEGDLGWFVVEMPFSLDNGGINELRFCALDSAGSPLGTSADPCVSAVVTRESPAVMAIVTEPAVIPHAAAPGEVVSLDGSQSVMAEGGIALWTTGVRSAYLGNPWQKLSETEQTSDLSELVTTTLMTYGSATGFRARLVVAASPEDLPAELWPEDGSLPCSRSQGGGMCDSFDVRFESTCFNDHETAQVVMDQPTGPLNVRVNESMHLQAHVASPNLDPFAFRWLVYRGSGSQKWLVTTIGADDDGQGFSISNHDLQVIPAAEGLGVGNYTLYAEARYPASGCSGPAWYLGSSNGYALTVGHTLDGVAPGRVVEGETFRVYSRSWNVGEDGYVFIDDDTGDAVDPIIYFGTVQPGGYLEITPQSGELPATGVDWFVSVGHDLEGTARSAWFNALRVEPAGSAAIPLLVADEEDTSCGGAGTECAHAILPGQTWRGEWGEPGDADYFSFIAGAGTGIRVRLERTDTTLPPRHPDAPSPEILLVRPDNAVFAASETLGLDETRADLGATLTMDGRYIIVVRTPKGSGQFLVTLTKEVEGGTATPSFGFTNARTHLTTEAHSEARLRVPLVDGFGNPLAGAEVSWDQGSDCGMGDFCGTGATVATRSSLDGHAVATVTPEPGSEPLWRPRALLSETAKSMSGRDRATSRIAKPKLLQPVLGALSTSVDAVISSDLPDLSMAQAITAAARYRAEHDDRGFLKDGSLCGSHDNTCPVAPEPVFRAVKLELAEGEELTDVSLRILQGGAPTDNLDGHEVMTDLDLELEAVATVRNGQGAEREFPITDPISMAVSEGAGGALSNGISTCNRLDVLPGGFTFKAGSIASILQAYSKPDGSPCCWQPTEVVTATVVIKSEVDDGEGGSILVTKEATITVESIPRPADACELRSLQIGTPQLASYSDYPAIQAGTVYLIDACGNIVHGLGKNDSPYHDQPGDEVRITSPLDPPGEGVWATAQSKSDQWSFDLFLNGDVGEPDAIPHGSYTIELEIASESRQCSAGGTIQGSYTVQTSVGEPQVALWWDWIWDAQSSPRGPDPEDTLISPGSALRDRSGAIAVWRVPAFDDGSVDQFFEGPYTDVPVRLYVASTAVPFDENGDIRAKYLEPVEGVELCTGVVEKLTDAAGNLDYNSPVRTSCDTAWSKIADAQASSDPSQTGYTPDTWVPVGLGVGVSRGPEQPGRYVLVVEPTDEAFRRGDSWKVTSSLVPDGFVGFEVGGGMYLDERYRPITEPIIVSPYPSSLAAKSSSGQTVEPDRRVITVEVRAWTTVPTINVLLEMHWDGQVGPDVKSVDMQFDHLEFDGKTATYRRRIGIRRPGADEFSDEELDPGLSVVSFVLDPGHGVLKTILDGQERPAVEQLVLFPVIEFIDDAPTYSRVTDPGSADYDPSVLDSDNYFLREDSDHMDLDIFYRLLPESLEPERVEFFFFEEDTATPIGPEPMLGETDAAGKFETGDELQVRWQGADNGYGQPKEMGFYRVQMAVKFPGLDEKIVTPIDDGDEGEGSALGWQCPQNSLAIHDLVWKHRPRVHVHWSEIGTPTNRFNFKRVSGDHVHRWEYEHPIWVMSAPIQPIPSGNESLDTFWDLFDDNIWTNRELTDPQYFEGFRSDDGYDTLLFSSRMGHAQTQDPPNGDVVFLQYWMFENFSTTSFNVPVIEAYPTVWHEGDVEYIQIAVMTSSPSQLTAKETWLRPIALTASQHYYAQTMDWDPGDGESPASRSIPIWMQRHIEHSGNERPAVYIALGSHATYLAAAPYIKLPGMFDTGLGTEAQYEAITEPEVEMYDTTCIPQEGSLTNCEDIGAFRLLDDYHLLPLSSDEEFSEYQGLWGFQTDDILPGNDGPPGPLTRAAKGVQGPVNLWQKPCTLHNGAVRSGSEFDFLRLTCYE